MENQFTPGNLLDQMAVGLVAVDTSGIIRSVNCAAERLLSKPRRHLVGAPLERILPGHPVALELLDRARRLMMPCRFRNAQLHPLPGAPIAVSLTALPLLDEHGEAIGGLLQLEEVGAAERLEAGQRLHETLDSLGSLALAVAHEVKNPLAGIRGAAQLLDMEPVSDSARVCTALIRSEVDRISRLLDSLLGLAEVPTAGEEELNIHVVLNHVLQICQTTPPLPERDYDPSLPNIRGNRDRLVQLFLNLVQNAQQAAGTGGKVRLVTRIADGIRMERGRRCQHVAIEVRDNGPGIPPELRERIFQPFVTTKPQGTGLGLAIAQKIVHDHGGVLEVDSRPGQTLFRVVLAVSR